MLHPQDIDHARVQQWGMGKSTSDLRAVVATGLNQLNKDNGGRYLSKVANQIGVDRATVGRWVDEKVTISVDNCHALADRYPGYFDRSTLLALQLKAAGLDTAGPSPTVLSAGFGFDMESSYRLAFDVLTKACPLEERTLCHASLHRQAPRLNDVRNDPHVPEEARAAMTRFQEEMVSMAQSGWNVRSVSAIDSPQRVEDVVIMAKALDGPNVDVRAYVAPIPPMISMLIVGNSDVLLSVDHPRWGKPEHGSALSSTRFATWARTYFDVLFHDAPVRIRSPKGLDHDAIAELRMRMPAD